METTTKFQFRLPSNEHTALRIKALQENKSLSELVEEILEDVLSGRIDVTVTEQDFQPTSTTLSTSVVERFDAYVHKSGMPKNKLVRLAVAAKMQGATTMEKAA